MANSNIVRRVPDHLPPIPATTSATTTTGQGDRDRALQLTKFREFYGRERPKAARDDEPGWRSEVVHKLIEYAELAKGWDSYSGLPLRWDVSQFALTVLSEIMQSKTPVPNVVLGSNGGIQFEWHEKEIDLELYMTAPYESEVWFHDRRTGENLSVELSNDFTALARPIAELTSR